MEKNTTLINGSPVVSRSIVFGGLVSVAMMGGDVCTLRSVARVIDALEEFDNEVNGSMYFKTIESENVKKKLDINPDKSKL